MRTMLIAIAFLVFPLLCWSVASPKTDPARTAWEKQLQEIASTYTAYGRVDRLVRWSPEDCRAPIGMGPTMHLSRSEDTDTHGQKLYSVFAKIKQWDRISISYRQSYLPPAVKEGDRTKRGPAPVGQVIVKEAWTPEAVTDAEQLAELKKLAHSGAKRTPGDRAKGERHDLIDYGEKVVPLAYHQKEQLYYKAGKKAGLFIMFKVDPSTPGTDRGWVYGTVAGDGKTVTAAGQIASCMKCHEQAPHDRLFGLKE